MFMGPVVEANVGLFGNAVDIISGFVIPYTVAGKEPNAMFVIKGNLV